MFEELHDAVPRLIRQVYKPFRDPTEMVFTFAEVARAATRSSLATVTLHHPQDLSGDLTDAPAAGRFGQPRHFPIVYQDSELGILSVVPASSLDERGTETCRLVAKTLAYHLKRRELSELARQLFGQELGLIGTSSSLRNTDRFIERASQVWLPSLILGDLGSEASAVALALHLASPGRKGRFVVIDCATLDVSGFERQWRARIRRGVAGTLVLNGIEALASTLQPQVCEALVLANASRSRGRGGWQNVRLVAIASLELEELVRQGRFYRPLFEHLALLRLEIEPLRNRQEDLKPLLEHYLAICTQGGTVKLSDEVLAVCAAYPWPGNVAELSRVVGRLAMTVEAGCVRLRHLESFAPELLKAAESSPAAPVAGAEPPALRILEGGRASCHPSLQRAVDCIAANYPSKLSLGEVAASAYVSPSHLEHLFKRELRTTFTRFLSRLRIERAQALLQANPYASVTAIAGDVGFNDLRHFQRMFKLVTGCTPNSFRRRHQDTRRPPSAQNPPHRP